MNGQIPTGNLSLTRNRTAELRQDNGLPNIQGSLNSLQNGLLGLLICFVFFLKFYLIILIQFFFSFFLLMISSTFITKWFKYRPTI